MDGCAWNIDWAQNSGGYSTLVSWVQVTGTHMDVSMMVPRLDLANHSFDANADWSADFSRGVLTLTATKDLAENEHVCIDYGPGLDNAHLMRVFGFAVPGNPNDRLDFLEQRNGDSGNSTSLGMSQGPHPAQSLMAGPFCNAVDLDSILRESEGSSWYHNGQDIVSGHENANPSRRFSAMASLLGCAALQHWAAYQASNSHDDGQRLPPQRM